MNCQGLGSASKRRDVLNFYRKKNYSIVCLQDTHFTPELERYIETQWGYKCIFNSYCSNSRGVAFLFNNNFELKVHTVKKDNQGNLLAIDLSIDDNRVTLINVYGPNSDNPNFFNLIRDTLLELDNLYFIVCGDFNLVLDPVMDTFNYLNINNPQARSKLLEIMNDMNLVDYFRVLNPDKKIYTWHKKNPTKHGRLDFFLTSENLSNIIENIEIKPGYRSDHSAVVLELKFNEFKRGKGLWKFNNTLLNDRDYMTKVKNIIEEVRVQYLDCPIDDDVFFETLLMEIRGMTISHSSYKKKQKDIEENKLIKEIHELESKFLFNDKSLEDKKIQLETLRREKMIGHIIRTKSKWVEHGEKPSKYFCNLESRNFINKTIKKVEKDNGDTITDQKEILCTVRDFYKNLYSDKEGDIIDIDLSEHINLESIPKLDKKTSDGLENPITESEVLKVLKQMKNNKTPGSDGFTVEFYKFFWVDLKCFIIKAINNIFEKKSSPSIPTTRHYLLFT